VRETINAFPFTSTVAAGITAPDESVTIPVIFPVVDTCAEQIWSELAIKSVIQSRLSRRIPKPYARTRVMTGLPNLIPQLTDAGGKGEWILHTIWNLCQPKRILNAEVGTGGGDVAGGADFAPTDAQLELLKTFEDQISAVDAEYNTCMKKEDIPAFNRALIDNAFPLAIAK